MLGKVEEFKGRMPELVQRRRTGQAQGATLSRVKGGPAWGLKSERSLRPRRTLREAGCLRPPASGPKGNPIRAQGAAHIAGRSGYVEVGWATMPQDGALLSISCPPGQSEVAGAARPREYRAARLHTSR